MLFESIDGLEIVPDGMYVDVSCAGGGHSKEILKRVGPEGKVFALDQDEDALKNTIVDDRFVWIHENLRYVNRSLKFHQRS